jgi:type IV pilus assembly protein PilQ
VTPGPEKVEVVVEGQQPMIYTTFHLNDPFRLIVDMAGIGLGNFTDKIVVDQGPIRSIVPKAGEGNQVARLEIEMAESADANVRTEGTNLIVEVANPAPKEEPPVAQSGEAPQKPEETHTLLPLPLKEESLPAAKTIKNIRFDRSEGLSLVVTLDGQVTPQAFLLGKNRLVIDLPNVKAAMKAKIIAAKDRAVKQVRIGQHSDKVRLVLDLSKPVDYSLQQSGNELRVGLRAASKVAPPSKPQSATSASPEIAAVVPAPPVPDAPSAQVESVPDPVAPAAALAESEQPEQKPEPKLAAAPEMSKPETAKEEGAATAGTDKDKADIVFENGATPEAPKKSEARTSKYVGRRISLDFQDAEITNVIRLIADVSNLNIVLGEDIKGKVTLKLLNVPWDQALDIILKMNNLGQIREGNIIRVATLSNISKQQEEEAKAKDTQIRSEDLLTRVISVNYSKAKDLSEPLKKILSTRGDITIDDRTNTMIVKDIEKNLNDVERLVKTLDTRTPQVVIEARVVQVAPTFNRSLGIQWGANYRDISNGNIVGINSPSASSPFGTPTPDFAVNLPAASNFGGVGFNFGRLTDNPFNLDLRLSAGESQGLTRVVSTPKISVLDNQEAKIEQGESIPFATVAQAGATPSTTFVDANLTLLVTPHISSDGGVMMKIKITKNAPGEVRPGAAGPSILKKEATTNILVKDGETTVIGGIYETSKTDSVSGVPYLMDIPILGWFFKTNTKREDTSELLVFLTPHIVK